MNELETLRKEVRFLNRSLKVVCSVAMTAFCVLLFLITNISGSIEAMFDEILKGAQLPFLTQLALGWSPAIQGYAASSCVVIVVLVFALDKLWPLVLLMVNMFITGALSFIVYVSYYLPIVEIIMQMT